MACCRLPLGKAPIELIVHLEDQGHGRAAHVQINEALQAGRNVGAVQCCMALMLCEAQSHYIWAPPACGMETAPVYGLLLAVAARVSAGHLADMEQWAALLIAQGVHAGWLHPIP